MKKIILTAIAAILLLTGPSKAWADVEVDQIDCAANPANEACVVVTSDEEPADSISEPIDEPNDESPITIDENTEIIEDESEPETWPMYLALGALGVALLVFIVLNLFGGKKKK